VTPSELHVLNSILLMSHNLSRL